MNFECSLKGEFCDQFDTLTFLGEVGWNFFLEKKRRIGFWLNRIFGENETFCLVGLINLLVELCIHYGTSPTARSSTTNRLVIQGKSKDCLERGWLCQDRVENC